MNDVAWQERESPARWLGCLLIVVLLHVAAGVVLLWRAPREPLEIAPSAMIVDLAPHPPPAPVETPVEPSPPEPSVQPELSPPEPVAEPPPPPLPFDLPPPEPPPELALEPPLVSVAPAVPLPPRPQPPKRPPPPHPVTPRAPPSDAAPPVAAPPPAAPAPTAQSPAASTNWQSRLLAHLKQRMRYPADAQMRHQQGVALVRFSMSPAGAVLSCRLERSSGYALIDQAALDLIRRAEPLPALPAEMPQQPIELVVPLRYELN